MKHALGWHWVPRQEPGTPQTSGREAGLEGVTQGRSFPTVPTGPSQVAPPSHPIHGAALAPGRQGKEEATAPTRAFQDGFWGLPLSAPLGNLVLTGVGAQWA